MTETPNLPAVDDAIEGTVVDPVHAKLREIADKVIRELYSPDLLDSLWAQMHQPSPPDHHADPSIRVRMQGADWYAAGVVPGFLPVQEYPLRDPDYERMRRFQADYAIGLSVHRPGDGFLITGGF